jgi:raffinose/stachyose/melibiose transport system substrate-binding protein
MKCNKVLAVLLIFAVSLAAVLSLAGCNKAGSSSTGSPSAAAAGSEKVTIRIMHFFNNINTSPEAAAFAATIAKFEQEHPNVSIVQDATSDALEEKVRILGASNELPDIYVSKFDTIPSFVQSGQAQPLDPYLDSAWKSVFLPGVFDEYNYNGNIYGLPFRQAFNNMVFYNKKIFRNAGITEFPKTYEAFRAACNTLVAAGYIPISLGNKDRWPAESVMFNTMSVKITGPEWMMSVLRGGGAKFTDASFINACKIAQDMYSGGVFNKNINSVDVNYARAQYLNEAAAMFIGGSWDLEIINSDDPKGVIGKTGLALFPEFDPNAADKYVCSAVGWAFILNAKVQQGPHLDACIALL